MSRLLPRSASVVNKPILPSCSKLGPSPGVGPVKVNFSGKFFDSKFYPPDALVVAKPTVSNTE